MPGKIAGNRYLSIPGTEYVAIDAGSTESFAARVLVGGRELNVEALLRYNVSLSGTKRFKGNRRIVELALPEVSYAKGRHFFLPDVGIDEATFRVYRENPDGLDLDLTTSLFELLHAEEDYTFDNSRGWLYLDDRIEADTELVVTYSTAIGAEVGEPGSGIGAYRYSGSTLPVFSSSSLLIS